MQHNSVSVVVDSVRTGPPLRVTAALSYRQSLGELRHAEFICQLLLTDRKAQAENTKSDHRRGPPKKQNDKNRSSLRCIRNYYGGLSWKHITRRPKCSFSGDIYPFASSASLKRRGVRGRHRQMDRVCLFVWPASRSTLIGQRRGSSRLFARLVSATDLACSDGIPYVFQGGLKNEREKKRTLKTRRPPQLSADETRRARGRNYRSLLPPQRATGKRY